jgi:hypothetical protein
VGTSSHRIIFEKWDQPKMSWTALILSTRDDWWEPQCWAPLNLSSLSFMMARPPDCFSVHAVVPERGFRDNYAKKNGTLVLFHEVIHHPWTSRKRKEQNIFDTHPRIGHIFKYIKLWVTPYGSLSQGEITLVVTRWNRKAWYQMIAKLLYVVLILETQFMSAEFKYNKCSNSNMEKKTRYGRILPFSYAMEVLNICAH